MISFVGAGPGDPELITLKGQKRLQSADTVIYAGSLVPKALLSHCPEDCEIYNSAEMSLPEVLEVLIRDQKAGKKVVRLHTGDPAIYGAIREQMDGLKEAGINDFEVVPGVSSFLGAAAALKAEYTLPEVTQTVILTRMEGRTPVPPRESIASLASHQATMCIFLSVHMLPVLIERLKEGGYTGNTPIAIVEKATWPEQRIFRGTLDTIQEVLGSDRVPRTGMVVVGWALGDDYALSKLYDPNFSHMYRTANPS